MLEISEILQFILVMIVMLLATVSLLSEKIFQSSKKIYYLFISAGIIFLSFVSLKTILHIYLVRFYLNQGWGAVALCLLLFFIILSPLIILIYRTIQQIIHPIQLTNKINQQLVNTIQQTDKTEISIPLENKSKKKSIKIKGKKSTGGKNAKH